MRALAKNIAARAALGAGRWLHRGKTTVLYYHRFPARSAAQFRAQCEYLRQRHRVISMRQLTQLLRNGEAPPKNAVVITIDDGHSDFYSGAFPVLREFGFPATMYLPTAFLDQTQGHQWLWFDRFTYAFRHSPRQNVDLPATPGISPASYQLHSAENRATAAAQVVAAAQWLPSGARDAYSDTVIEALGIRIPETPPEEFSPLTWDSVRTMAAGGIEFGGHTVTHPILQTIANEAEELGFEIAHCKQRIEAELQAPVSSFAYPSGKADEIPPAAKTAVRQAGYATAVTTHVGQVGPDADPLWLLRIGVDPEVDPLWFQRCASAVVRMG